MKFFLCFSAKTKAAADEEMMENTTTRQQSERDSVNSAGERVTGQPQVAEGDTANSVGQGG